MGPLLLFCCCCHVTGTFFHFLYGAYAEVQTETLLNYHLVEVLSKINTIINDLWKYVGSDGLQRFKWTWLITYLKGIWMGLESHGIHQKRCDSAVAVTYKYAHLYMSTVLTYLTHCLRMKTKSPTVGLNAVWKRQKGHRYDKNDDATVKLFSKIKCSSESCTLCWWCTTVLQVNTA